MVRSVVILGLTLEAEINYLPVEALVNCSPIKPSFSHFRELEIHICGLASKGALVPPAEHKTDDCALKGQWREMVFYHSNLSVNNYKDFACHLVITSILVPTYVYLFKSQSKIISAKQKHYRSKVCGRFSIWFGLDFAIFQ
jgi:hypothetical protein